MQTAQHHHPMHQADHQLEGEQPSFIPPSPMPGMHSSHCLWDMLHRAVDSAARPAMSQLLVTWKLSKVISNPHTMHNVFASLQERHRPLWRLPM